MRRLSTVRTWSYASVTVAGALLLCMSSSANVMMAEATNGQVVSSGTDRQVAAKSATATERKLLLQMNAPYFSGPISDKNELNSIKVSYYGKRGDTFPIQKKVSGEMMNFTTEEQGSVWVPAWYSSENAQHVTTIDPTYLTITPQSRLSLTPGSSMTWTGSSVTEPDTPWSSAAIAKWKDWYGVIVAPAAWHEKKTVDVPLLMWIQKKDVVSEQDLSYGLFDINSSIPTHTIRNLTEMLLHTGDDAASIKELLGDPHFVETSSNLEQAGKTMQLGVTWRYERPDGQFTITLSKEGKLKQTDWILPAGGDDKVAVYWGAGNRSAYHLLNMNPPPTLVWEPEWRHQGTLNYTYLLGATDDVLLLMGDDGGFSGGHYGSSVYALNRRTGVKLWQIDAGYGMVQAIMDHKQKTVTIYTEFDTKQQKYQHQVRQLRLTDGKLLWETRPGKENAPLKIMAARDSVIVYELPFQPTLKGIVTVYSSANGKEKWHRELSDRSEIVNQGTEDYYVIIREGRQLKALDTNTGRISWSKKTARQLDTDNPENDPYYAGGSAVDPFKPVSTTRWTYLGDQWLLLDMKMGNASAQYPVKPGERFEVLAERYLLVQRPMEGEDYWSDGDFETKLYDTREQRTLWTLKGKASKGTIEGDIVYLTMDGVPAAVKKDSGHIVWKMKATPSEGVHSVYDTTGNLVVWDDYLLVPSGSNLLLLRKSDGSLLGRIGDVQTGYAELRDLETRNGTLNRSGDELYIGTANGAYIHYHMNKDLMNKIILRNIDIDKER